jgi:[ribosomal protein S5]-alanine N-acetyltransferase
VARDSRAELMATAILTRVVPSNSQCGELRVHLWSTADIEEMGDYWARNRRHLSATQPHRDPAFWTVEGQRQRVERASNDVAVGRMYPFLVREDGRLVAEIGLSDVTRGAFQSSHLGYSVDADRLRRGVASASVSVVADMAFNDLGLHRLQAATMVENIASQGVLERCNFERIGVATGYLAIAGAWADHVIWQRINVAMEPPATL